MKVLDCIKNGNRNLVSIEVEPPKIGHSRTDIFNIVDPLVHLGVKFINITYHSSRIVEHVETKKKKFTLYQRLHPGTSGIAGAIVERYAKYEAFPIPHLICTGFSKYDIEGFLHELACLGIDNVLALRGDGKRNEKGEIMSFEPSPGGYSHSNELIRQIAALRKGEYLRKRKGQILDFGIGTACYPEGHPESKSIEDELHWLKVKADAGADYFITQMFFDCDAYENFLNRTAKKGIRQAIIPGLKPLTTYRQINTLPKSFSCSIPKNLREKIEKYRDSEEDVRKIGIEWCIEQCMELKHMEAPGLHFYASRNAPVKEVIEILQESEAQSCL